MTPSCNVFEINLKGFAIYDDFIERLRHITSSAKTSWILCQNFDCKLNVATNESKELLENFSKALGDARRLLDSCSFDPGSGFQLRVVDNKTRECERQEKLKFLDAVLAFTDQLQAILQKVFQRLRECGISPLCIADAVLDATHIAAAFKSLVEDVIKIHC